jgi:alpha-L-fucosidase 2
MPRQKIVLHRPARGFTDSFVLGNGRLGATTDGGAGTATFDLNADTFWSGGPLTGHEAPDSAHLVPGLRDAIRRRDHARSDARARELQAAGWSQSYQPVGRLTWAYAPPADGDAYLHTLDLAEAVAATESAGTTLEAFVSAPADVLVAVTSMTDAVAAPTFTSPHPVDLATETDANGTCWLVATGRAPAHVTPNYQEDDDPVRYDAAAPDRDGLVDAGMAFAVVAAVQREGAGARLISTAVTGFRGWNQRPIGDPGRLVDDARGIVTRALDASTAELRSAHVAEHRGYFDRVDVDLGGSGSRIAEDAELLFHTGRYLLIASSRPGTQAANLQGIWNVDVRPAWSSNYTTNINVEMNYWGAEPTALPDIHASLFAFSLDLAEAGKETARRAYGFNGSVAHHNADLWRFTAPVKGEPVWSNWTGTLPWLAAHHWDHVAFGSAPAGFAEEVALPIHREAVRFTLDHLVEDGAGGLIASPSSSPENQFATPDGGRAAISEGTAMDRELAYEVVSHYLALLDLAGETRAEDTDLAARAKAALPRIRVADITDGKIDEWAPGLAGIEPGHRHLSHLYGMYPGTRIAAKGDDDAIAAVRASLAHRLEHGSGYTSWSQAWVLCLAARLRDAALAERSLRILADELTSDSLLGLHPLQGWPQGVVFQIDGNLGMIGGFCELIVQGYDDRIVLLPSLPPSWTAGSARGLKLRGGHTVDISWSNGTLAEATIVAGATGDVTLEIPGATWRAVDSAGVELATGTGTARLAMTRGGAYRVIPAQGAMM